MQMCHQSIYLSDLLTRIDLLLDPDQTMDTLVSLISKLVLKSTNPSQDGLILISVPRTHDSLAVTYIQVPGHHHVSVAVNKEQAHGIYTYSLDTVLGCVQDGEVCRGNCSLVSYMLSSRIVY
jgi:hypothetical protein